MKSYKLLCIIGPDGSGKSSLINAVKLHLQDATIMTIWDLMKEPVMNSIVPFKKPEEVDNYMSYLHHESRSLFLIHCLAEAKELARQKGSSFILTDSYWYKYYATELAHGASSEYLDKLVSVFEKPDYIFYITAEEKLTAERKKSFSRYECGFAQEINEQSFMKFQQSAIGHLQKLMQNIPYKPLKADNSVSENCRFILDEINITIK